MTFNSLITDLQQYLERGTSVDPTVFEQLPRLVNLAERDLAQTLKILGCHVVGERAVETVQLVAAGMKVGMTVEQLAELPLSFPTYVAIVGWAAYEIMRQLGLAIGEQPWEPHRVWV